MQARAPDHFDGSVQGLLANYCSALAESGRVAAAMAAEAPGTPRSGALTKDYATLTGLAASLARQLRLTKTSPLDKKAGELTERGVDPDPLLAGGIIAFPRP